MNRIELIERRPDTDDKQKNDNQKTIYRVAATSLCLMTYYITTNIFTFCNIGRMPAAIISIATSAIWYLYESTPHLPPPLEIRRWTLNRIIVRVLMEQRTGKLTLVYPDLITKIEKQLTLVLGRPRPSGKPNQLFKPEEEARIQKDFLDRFSAVIEKNRVILATPSYECSFNRRHIRFFQLQDEVVYQYNSQQGSVPIEKEILPVALQIAYIKACLVRISDQGVLSITPNPQVIHQWTTCSLLKEGDHFIWEIQLYGNNLVHIPADDFSNISIENRDVYFGNFYVNVDYYDNKIELVKVSAASNLDSSKKIDSDVWAVTLIDSGIRHASAPLTWGGHTMLVIEGVRIPEDSKRARYFMELADVGEANGSCGQAKVRFFSDGQIPPKKLRYQNKSQTFLINRTLVEWMIQKIKQQQNSLFNFNFFLNNCAIWALKMVDTVGIKVAAHKEPLVYTPANILDKLIKS